MLIPGVAVGQLVTVDSSGGANAQSGGNTAVGNESSNTGEQSQGVSLLGINLGGVVNSSSGTAQVVTGGAAATGNNSSTNVGQGSGAGRGGPQSAGVVNSGQAAAQSGGNAAAGNASNNVATGQQTVAGGLLGIGLNVGGPTNVSNGAASVVSGPANAVGNQSTTEVAQNAGGSHGCVRGRGTQIADVQNVGSAEATSGDNLALGNESTNEAAQSQVVEGGLLGLGVNVGGPTNVSSGVAAVHTGPSTAVGNDATTAVNQANCVLPTAAPAKAVHTKVTQSKLALTGFPSTLLSVAALLLVVGSAALMVPRSRVRIP